MKLLIQPGDGIGPLLKGIEHAKVSIEIMIFRFNRTEIEKALVHAVERGVKVHALIAYTNRGGEKSLRKLESRFLAAGVTVARTADDLVRYHAKFMIVDRRELYLLAFNFTYLDIEASRSFAVITSQRKIVLEACKLFEADTKRQRYDAGSQQFVVSPVNARKQLSAFIKDARKELLIYDPKIADPSILRLLDERVKAGVDVRIIGKLAPNAKLTVRKLAQMRLHTRSMIRDRAHVFIGSQSLREFELDARREVGLILNDKKIAAKMIKVFEDDWSLAAGGAEPEQPEKKKSKRAKVARKVAQAVAENLPDLAPVVQSAIRDAAGIDVDSSEIEKSVHTAITEAVHEAIKDAKEAQ